MDQLLLPPSAAAGPQPYNAAADAAELDAKPLQDYTSEWTKEQAQPEPEPPPVEPEAGTGSAEDAKDVDASAREFIELYDLAQSYGFHFYSSKPAEDFALPKFAKDRAAYHLAKGLAAMGSPTVPWWIGLLIALAPPAALNFMSAKQYKQDKAEREEHQAQQQRRQWSAERGTGAAAPDHIFRADGSMIKLHPDAPAPAAPPPPASAPKRTKPAKYFGPCEVCGEPVKAKGRKTCSQSCSGKLTSQKNREKKQTT